MRRSARLLAATSSRTLHGVKLEATNITTQSVTCVSAREIPSLKAEGKRENDASDGWVPLCSTRDLSCALTLESGQVFSWRRHPKDPGTWLGVVGRRVFALRENNNSVQFQCLHPSALPCKQGLDELSRYFRLDMDAEPLYDRWTKPVDRMAEIVSRLRGMRIVRQDPVECLFSFICSSNNNITRIQGMVDKLKSTYGDLIYKGEVEDQEKSQHLFYAFPSVDTLVDKCKEEKLRALGFGYRAAFIVKSAKQLQELGGDSYLNKIRDGEIVQPKAKKLKSAKYGGGKSEVASDHAYQDALMVFAGVGRKVADCVALFSLEKLEAIPVDTHVWQIACRELDSSLNDRKSITPSVYLMVGDLFRKRFAPQAGWAHSVLFAGDLSTFQSELPDGMKKTKAKRVNVKTKVKSSSKG